MSISRAVNDRTGLWALWILATTLGASVGIAIGSASGSAFSIGISLLYVTFDITVGSFVDRAIYNIVIEVVAGAIIGLMQWLILRQYLNLARWWILVSIAGGVIGTLTSTAISFIAPITAGTPIRAIVEGASIGISQWLLLKGEMRYSEWWVPANVISAPIAWGTQQATFQILLIALAPIATSNIGNVIAIIAGNFFGGISLGFLTGLTTGFVISVSFSKNNEEQRNIIGRI